MPAAQSAMMPPTVLLFTTAMFGQSNVFLSTSYELALAGMNVCISSFPSLKTRVESLQELITRHESRSDGRPMGSVTFHEFKGLIPYWDAIGKNGVNAATLPHPRGVFGALEHYRIVYGVIFPWSVEEHLTAIETAKEMIATMKPHIVVAEIMFNPAIDACKVAGQKFMILYPNSIKDLGLKAQPWLAALWKYPAPSSGYPYPLQWWQIPLNIYLYLRVIIRAITLTRAREIRAMQKSLGINDSVGDMDAGVKYICPALPETDFPFAVIPEAIIPCGPIVMPFDPLEESDPTLMRWLDHGPTAIVNMGSLAILSEKVAREMAGAFRILLDYHDRKAPGKFQVFWKANIASDLRKVIDDIIGKEIEEGRVKVVPWVEVEPVSILQHPNVVCTVHHGGANSYFEGVWSGMPHVVLPLWSDTYDYANRAEFLNIGVFGNKSCAPDMRTEELSQALLRVTGDTEEAVKFRSAAKQLKEVCRAKGNGRKLACAAILNEMSITD